MQTVRPRNIGTTIETINGAAWIESKSGRSWVRVTFEDDPVPCVIWPPRYWAMMQHEGMFASDETAWMLNRRVQVRHQVLHVGDKSYDARELVRFL